MTKTKKSIWVQLIVLLMFLDGLAFLSTMSLIPAVFNFYVGYRIWELSKGWRDFTFYIRLPLGVIVAMMAINDIDYSGELMVLECIIYAVLFVLSRKEFGNNETV